MSTATMREPMTDDRLAYLRAWSRDWRAANRGAAMVSELLAEVDRTRSSVVERERDAFLAGAFYAELEFYAETVPSPDAFPALVRAAAAERYPMPAEVEA